MKILICVDRLTGGGAQRVASLWAQGFLKCGHKVSIVLSNNRTPITYSIPPQIKIFSVDFNIKNGYVRHLCKSLFLIKKLRRIFQNVKPDVIIGVGISWAQTIDKARGDMIFKVVMTDHSSYERPATADSPISDNTQHLRFVFNKRFDAVTVLTQADKNYICDRLNNVYVLPNPLAFEPIWTENQKKEKSVLAVGRLNVPLCKGFDLLIEAFSKIANEFPEWRLCIMGDGDEAKKRSLRSMAKTKNIDNVFDIIPFQTDPLPIYRKSAIFCLSSRYEGFGMVLIEAMSQGCACVACDYKGRQREIIPNDDYGLICEAGDVDALANALKKMISDEGYRHKVERNAPKRSEFYSLDNIMQRWNEIFKQSGILAE